MPDENGGYGYGGVAIFCDDEFLMTMIIMACVFILHPILCVDFMGQHSCGEKH